MIEDKKSNPGSLPTEPSETPEVDLHKEAILDGSIYPALIRRTGFSRFRVQDAARPPRNVLLTGCTGFLGAHLLSALLLETDVVVYCLVRAKGQEEGEMRVENVLSQYDLLEDSSQNGDSEVLDCESVDANLDQAVSDVPTLIGNLPRRKVSMADLVERTVVLIGDLSKPLLGIDQCAEN